MMKSIFRTLLPIFMALVMIPLACAQPSSDQATDESPPLIEIPVDKGLVSSLTQPPDCRISFNRWEGICMINTDGTDYRCLPISGEWHSWSPDGSMIVYQDKQPGNSELYVMTSEGTNPTRITRSPGHDVEPSWSPDGKKIAFASDRDGYYEIYTINYNGTGPVRLTENEANDREPSWSPDSSRIVFISDRDEAKSQAYIMNADGSDVQRLTEGLYPVSRPRWSPDGSRILFTSSLWVYGIDPDGSNMKAASSERGVMGASWSPCGNWIATTSWILAKDPSTRAYAIRIVNAKGEEQKTLYETKEIIGEPEWCPVSRTILAGVSSKGASIISSFPVTKQIAYVYKPENTIYMNIFSAPEDKMDKTVQLTRYERDNVDPAWSPDGRKIAFSSKRDGDFEIFVMDADGGNQTQLTRNKDSDGAPAWSPDGKKIAFHSWRDKDWEIYVFSSEDGWTEQTRLTDSEEQDTNPCWSPDGKYIAFLSRRDGKWDIYRMNADGSNQVKLTDSTADEGSPAWSPDGKYILFDTDRDGNWEIYRMDADGGNPANLSNDPGSDRAAAWSGDGKRIIFQTDRDGNKEIYIMNADGSNQTNFTMSKIDETDPCWQP